MLKRDDPAVKELIADIRAVVAARYRYRSVLWPDYIATEREDGLPFEQLKPDDQFKLLDGEIRWEHYKDRGLSNAQAGVIFDNVRDGKPQEKWLEGIFDEAVLENRRISSFKAMVEDSRNSPSNYYFDEMDGESRPWAELSAAAKLQYIALDAARCDVGFQPFAEMVKDTIGDAGEAALRVVLEGRKELHAIGKLFPDDGRTESTPLVEQVKDMLDYASALETQENERRQGREKLFEGISNVLDGKPPQGWSECAKAFQDILRGDHPKQPEVRTQDRGIER